MHYETFGSSDESDHSLRGSSRSSSLSYDASAKYDDVDDSLWSHRSRISPSDRGDRSASSYAGTTQEEQDRNALRSAPENKPWMPYVSELTEWYGYTTRSCQIPLFDSSRIHGLDPTARDYHTEHEF